MEHNNYVLWERYFDAIRRSASPEDLERILKLLWSPEDLERLFKLLGSPDNAEAMHRALKELIEREEYWQRTKRNVVTFVKALTGAGVLITVAGAVWKMFFGG